MTTHEKFLNIVRVDFENAETLPDEERYVCWVQLVDTDYRQTGRPCACTTMGRVDECMPARRTMPVDENRIVYARMGNVLSTCL